MTSEPTRQKRTPPLKGTPDPMSFGSNADRTNLEAVVTVALADCLPGGRPLVYIATAKSHAGKDTCADFVIDQKGRAK